MATEELVFVGGTGAELSGVLHRPDGEARGSVLLAHCFTCSKDIQTMMRLAGGLADAGYAALRFDFTGLGSSGGDFAATTVSTDVGDLARAAHALIERGFGPCAMVGHSLGGAATLLAAHKVKSATCVAVLGAPSTPSHIRRLLADDLDADREGETVVEIGGRPFPISQAFLDDLGEHEQQRRVAEVDRPLLVLHAVDDTVVDISEGDAIFAAAHQPKAFWPLVDADHLLTSRAKAGEALQVLLAWLEQTG
jgi:putative redox protein